MFRKILLFMGLMGPYKLHQGPWQLIVLLLELVEQAQKLVVPARQSFEVGLLERILPQEKPSAGLV